MRGKLYKDYRVRKAKAKKPCISALSNKTVCTLHKVARGSTSKTQSHDAGAAFSYATQTQQLFCFEVAVCFLCMPSYGTGPQRGTCGCAQGNVHCCTSSSNPARNLSRSGMAWPFTPDVGRPDNLVLAVPFKSPETHVHSFCCQHLPNSEQVRNQVLAFGAVVVDMHTNHGEPRVPVCVASDRAGPGASA